MKYKMRLHHFFVVHSDMSLWKSMGCMCPFLTHGFWKKVVFIARIEFLWDHINKERSRACAMI